MKTLLVLGSIVWVFGVSFFPGEVVALLPASEDGDVTLSFLTVVIGVPFALVVHHTLFVRLRPRRA